jgi:gamma-glutamyltranspeptidase / glutathione hydrolase
MPMPCHRLAEAAGVGLSTCRTRRATGQRARTMICTWAVVALMGSCAQGGGVREIAPAPSLVTPPPATTSSAPTAAHLPEGWPYSSRAPSVTGSRGMVVTDAKLATAVGRDILASGGNAVDAAVAVAFALAVVLPAAGNIGGGGFMVARVGGVSRALDFREVAPLAATHDMFIGKDGKPNGASHDGYEACAVPGSVAGLWEAFETLGSKRKTWADLLRPAIQLAREGFEVGDGLARAVADQESLKRYSGSAALFYPNGSPLAPAAVWKNPDLAGALTRIADLGPKGFYEGKTADLLVAEMRRGGGLISHRDLEAYKAKWRSPIEFDYRGHHVFSMPLPSSGGITLAMIGHILSAYDLRRAGWHSPRSLHWTFEAMRRAFLARNSQLGDPDFVENRIDVLLSDEWAKRQRVTIDDDRATPSNELSGNRATEREGMQTTHFAVVDEQSNAVAVTTTLNWWFGSGITVTGAGFVLNDEMDDFATVPGTANGFGLVQGEANAIAPGKRMLSSMAPTVVMAPDGSLELVLGAAGGPTIITSVFEILSSVVDFGLDVTSAVNAPRFHQQDFPDVVTFEARGLEGTLEDPLSKMGYRFKEVSYIADAPAIGREGNQLVGVAEPRRHGGLGAGW